MLFIKELKKILQLIKLSHQAFGRYKWHIVVLTCLGFLGGVLGGIGINAIIPLFSSFAGESSKELDAISRYIEKFFLFFNIDFALKYLLILIVLLFVFKALISILFSYIRMRIALDYEEQTRNKLFKGMAGARWQYLLKQKLGHLEKVLMTNVPYCRAILTQISDFIQTFTTLIAYTVVAINISFTVTLTTFGLGGLLFLALKPIIRRIRSISYETEQINRDIAHHINENILGMKTIKAMSAGQRVVSIARDYFRKIRNISIRSYILGIFTSSFIEPLSVIFIAVIFAISYKSSNFNIAVLIAVIYLAKQIFSYITELQQLVIGMNAKVPYLKKILEYETAAIQHRERETGTQSFQFTQALEFRDIHFSYESGKEVLSGINFKIEKGEIVGLIGPSGAGKTTIVDLCLRLFEPNKGQLLLDGKDISEINLEDWRKNIGYVSQDIFVINETIANNIKFYDNTIGPKDIERASRMANIYDFIQGCEGGFSTMVGERGIQLSAGQRQRLIIARVLARKPELLILDEATSALDNESERKIQQVIKGLKGKITVFVIAHRLSTVMNSDRLIALENGKIVEEGNAHDLLKDKRSYFSKVYSLK